MKKAVKIIFCFLVCYIFLERLPVKRCISLEEAYEKMNTNNTYICEFEATTGPDWRIYTENETTSALVWLEGNVPNDDINKASFFWFGRNKFLIQGEVTGIREMGGECYDIINVTEWDIIEPIDRGDSFRFLEPKDALNLFDFIG